jgi:4-amino-4-deoxy-L-arabinose transferase
VDPFRQHRWNGRRSAWVFPLLLLALALVCNGTRPLWSPDEGRYVAAALEMLRRHDFLGIYLNDDTAHFTKPPLTYWTIAAALAAFGKSEFVARLPNALAYVATALLLLPAGRLLTPGMPALPMILYGTTLLPFLAAGAITTDTLVALWTTLGGVAFLHYQAAVRPHASALLMWLAFGLAFLTKGPPSLLPLLAFLGWLAARRDWRGLRGLAMSWGLPLFAVVGLGWYVAASARFPGLLHYFLEAELAARVASGSFHRNSAWYMAIAVYVPTLLVGALPWLPAWLAFGRRPGFAPALQSPTDRLLLVWIGVPLLVHVVAESRLPLYLLPLFPPIALWLARRAEPVAARMTGCRIAVVVVGCGALLLGAKLGLGQLSPADRDGRAAALRARAAAPAGIADVVYVDVKPWWELRYYLGVQVREAWVAREPHEPAYQPARPLEEVLRGRKAAARLYAVRRTSVREFLRRIGTAGGCAARRGEDAQVVYFTVSTGAGGPCGRGGRVAARLDPQVVRGDQHREEIRDDSDRVVLAEGEIEQQQDAARQGHVPEQARQMRVPVQVRHRDLDEPSPGEHRGSRVADEFPAGDRDGVAERGELKQDVVHGLISAGGGTIRRSSSHATPNRSRTPWTARRQLLYFETPFRRGRWLTGTSAMRRPERRKMAGR